jgi:hypothetical protein
VSTLHCFSHVRKVELKPMQFVPTAQSRLVVQMTPAMAAPAGAHEY